MMSWDVSGLWTVGEDLLELANETYSELIKVEHRVLYLCLREAGLGIRDHAEMLQKGELKEGDKEYFRSVHEALRNIFSKIETGEYYEALIDVASKREEEVYSSLR
jgi:hypothetical protein